MLAYSIVVATALTGLVGLPWWMVLVGATGLVLVSMSEHVTYRSRSHRIGAAQVMSLTWSASAFNGTLASCAAFLLGRASAVMWGI